MAQGYHLDATCLGEYPCTIYLHFGEYLYIITYMYIAFFPGYLFVPLVKTKMADTRSVFVDVVNFMEGKKSDKGTSMYRLF